MKFIFTYPVYLQGIRVSFVYEGHRVKVKVTGAKKGKKFPFPQCKTLCGHNSSSVKHRTMRSACRQLLVSILLNMGFSAMADRMV